jgi:hypothetical protein
VPESTLTLSVNDLRAAIGHYLGYGRGVPFGEGPWDVYQTNNINDMLKSGLSNVYTPEPLTPTEPAWKWSWLEPIDTIVLTVGKSEAVLPDGFGGFQNGELFVKNAQANHNPWCLRLTHVAKVEHQYSIMPTTTGYPRLACEKVLPGTSVLGSTRSHLYVWPIPDQPYTLTGIWKHLPGLLTGSFPYHPGGAEHSELFKASCIAEAALQIDDDPSVRKEAFKLRLAASIQADRKRKGQFIGYNGDNSDGRQRVPRMPGWSRFYDNNPVTYNGGAL